MHLLRTNFGGDPNLGLYGFATDSYCFLGFSAKKKIKQIKKTLKVSIHHSTILNTALAGIFCAGNSSGIIVPKIVEEYEMEKIENMFERVLILDSRYTALGNLILMNDKGIILSPLLRRKKKEIEIFFNIPCRISTIAGLKILATGMATNKGCLVHPKVREKELNALKNILKIDIDVGTVNFGSPFVKAGLIANSKGAIVSEISSGPELGKVSEVLGFL